MIEKLELMNNNFFELKKEVYTELKKKIDEFNEKHSKDNFFEGWFDNEKQVIITSHIERYEVNQFIIEDYNLAYYKNKLVIFAYVDERDTITDLNSAYLIDFKDYILNYIENPMILKFIYESIIKICDSNEIFIFDTIQLEKEL